MFSIRSLLNVISDLKFKCNRIILNGINIQRGPRKPVSDDISEISDEKKRWSK
jgi:hypothetical protein